MVDVGRIVLVSSLALVAVGLSIGSLFVPWYNQTIHEEYCYEYSFSDDDCYIDDAELKYKLDEIEIEYRLQYDGDGDGVYEDDQSENASIDWKDVGDDAPWLEREADSFRAGFGLLIGGIIVAGLVMLGAVGAGFHPAPKWVGVGLLGLAVVALIIANIVVGVAAADVGELYKEEFSSSTEDPEDVSIVKDPGIHVGPFLAAGATLAGIGALAILISVQPGARRPRGMVGRYASGAQAPPPQPSPGYAAAPQVTRRRCPRCSSIVEVQVGQRPVCWECGFGG